VLALPVVEPLVLLSAVLPDVLVPDVPSCGFESMNWPLLPVIPEPDDEVAPGDAVLPVLDPLDVLDEPFHAPRQPVYVTVRPLDEYDDVDCPDCEEPVEPDCEPVVEPDPEPDPDWLPVDCAPTVTPAMAMAPQVAMILLVMRCLLWLRVAKH